MPNRGSLSGAGADRRAPAATGPLPAASPGREHEAARRLLLAELDRVRGRVEQQEHTLTVLTQAISVLRSGSRALRDENRELRRQLRKGHHTPRRVQWERPDPRDQERSYDQLVASDAAVKPAG